MVQTLFIGIAAGAAAAVLSASSAAGSPLSLLFVSLAPLPILIAALGWTRVAGLIATALAAAALALALDARLAFAFLISVGLPAWWLSYLTLLARPAWPQNS